MRDLRIHAAAAGVGVGREVTRRKVLIALSSW
jgi:hypothetical protein